MSGMALGCDPALGLVVSRLRATRLMAGVAHVCPRAFEQSVGIVGVGIVALGAGNLAFGYIHIGIVGSGCQSVVLPLRRQIGDLRVTPQTRIAHWLTKKMGIGHPVMHIVALHTRKVCLRVRAAAPAFTIHLPLMALQTNLGLCRGRQLVKLHNLFSQSGGVLQSRAVTGFAARF